MLYYTCMPQVSLYLDNKTLKAVELKAKARKISVSRYVKEAIEKDIHSHWPEDYFRLFGSVSDPTLRVPQEISFATDRKREDFK
jgi:hypothetical protein